MIRAHLIERALQIIVAQCDPEQVFLIGSHAVGTAGPNSDLDLIVVQRSDEAPSQREMRVEQLLAPLLIPVDVSVYTPEEFREELSTPNSFAQLTIELQSVLLYSREREVSAEVRS